MPSDGLQSLTACFNGAAVVRPRRVAPGIGQEADLRRSFNGAAVVRPRRGCLRVSLLCLCEQLQRGRGRETAESMATAKDRLTRAWASTGPRS